MIAIGKIIPDGTYQAYHEDKIRPVILNEYRGRWLILLFYPGDFTFVCPTELADTARLYPEFKKLGAEVCGVSIDSAYVHKAWHDSSPTIRHVEFPFIADTTGSLSRVFGVYLRCMTTASGGMRGKCSASFRRRDGCGRGRVRSVALTQGAGSRRGLERM